MRMRQEIPFAWVSDALRRAYHTPTFSGAGDFLRRYASVYRADLWEGFSETYVEVWAESRSLASVLETDCKELQQVMSWSFSYSGSWDGSLLGWALYISRSKCYAEFLRR